jgi:hypothetical protein
MRVLSSIAVSTVPASVAEANFALLDYTVFTLAPTLVAGVPNVDQGPPVAGTWATADRYVDALGGEWACAVGGTPGTWIQIRPAFVTADPSGTIATGYVIIRTDLHWEKREWDGAVWAEIAGTSGTAIPDATGGSVIDVEGRAATNAILALLRTKGLLNP